MRVGCSIDNIKIFFCSHVKCRVSKGDEQEQTEAAQTTQLPEQGSEVTIVTTNVGHLAQFVAASHWQDLPIDRD